MAQPRKAKAPPLAGANENGIIPNAWQTPNIFIDKINPYLTSEEWRVLSFACRHIFGWTDNVYSRQRRMSLSFFENGYGPYPGCGLTRPTIVKALESLKQYGIMVAVGDPTNDGQLWEIPSSEKNIDYAGLAKRNQAKRATRQKNTEKGRSAYKAKMESGLSDKPVESSGLSDKPVVYDINQKGFMAQTSSGLSHKLNQNHSLKPSSKPNNTFTPDGEGDSPITQFIETELFEEPTAEEVTEQQAYDLAVCYFFGIKHPTQNNNKGWSHIRKMGNFFRGKIGQDKPNDAFKEFQFKDEPFTPLEIIGMRLWWTDQFDDISMLQKPATIAEKETIFRPTYDEKLEARAQRRLEKEKEKVFGIKAEPAKKLIPVDVEKTSALIADLAAMFD